MSARITTTSIANDRADYIAEHVDEMHGITTSQLNDKIDEWTAKFTDATERATLAFDAWGRSQCLPEEGALAIKACNARLDVEYAEMYLEAIRTVLDYRADR